MKRLLVTNQASSTTNDWKRKKIHNTTNSDITKKISHFIQKLAPNV
jgi:hypothetical protein